MKRVRIVHSYLSAFVAPMLIFFAGSGFLQILGLHEAHGENRPNAIVAAMASVHKNQTLATHGRRPPDGSPGVSGTAGGTQNAGGPPSPGGPPEGRTTTLGTVLLKGLFVAEAIALIVTTLFGLWIGIAHAKRKRPFLIVLGAGTALPVLFLLIH